MNININFNMNSGDTMLIETAKDYTLKYDEKTEGLRDKTYSELVKEYVQGNIKCPCSNRVYHISSQFVKSHFVTQKHNNWLIQSQNDYIKNYGHCCSPQDIVNLQNKELRGLKCNISHLTSKNKALVQENIRLEESHRRLQEEVKVLKNTIGEYEGENDIFVECN